jgi:hypothetical protein
MQGIRLSRRVLQYSEVSLRMGGVDARWCLGGGSYSAIASLRQNWNLGLKQILEMWIMKTKDHD